MTGRRKISGKKRSKTSNKSKMLTAWLIITPWKRYTRCLIMGSGNHRKKNLLKSSLMR